MVLDQYRSLEQFAIDEGAHKAKVIRSEDIVIDDRVRLKCQVPVCQYFNRHLLCPPHTLSVAEFRSLCSQYPAALLVQAASQGFEENSLLEAEKKLHLLVNKVEGRALSEGHYLASGFIASSCKLCAQCVGYNSKEPCRRPYEARPSIEAMGVDIFKTSQNAEIGFSLGLSSEVVFSGLILLD
ncbi:MAG: DUF2284 domain-containing protein [Thermincola sp.]|nr:DUF2284 domain-containing protein [Thermincola sp.]MDT3703603.1 DUF2284 domain-containing protein [Thermincola sp.]